MNFIVGAGVETDDYGKMISVFKYIVREVHIYGTQSPAR